MHCLQKPDFHICNKSAGAGSRIINLTNCGLRLPVRQCMAEPDFGTCDFDPSERGQYN